MAQPRLRGVPFVRASGAEGNSKRSPILRRRQRSQGASGYQNESIRAGSDSRAEPEAHGGIETQRRGEHGVRATADRFGTNHPQPEIGIEPKHHFL